MTNRGTTALTVPTIANPPILVHNVKVRFDADVGHNADVSPCPLSANRRHRSALFDHLVGKHKQAMWYGGAESLACLEVYDEIELGRLFNWNIAGLRSSQKFINQFTHASSLRSWQ
jgi:hypothetical protein